MNFKLLKGLCLAAIAVAFISCGDNDSKDNRKKVTRKIEVTGSAEMELSPDEIYMTFTLNEYLKGGKKVKIDAIKTEFEAACKKVGVKNDAITISSLAGNERWDYYWYYRRRHEPNFMGSITYSVKVNSTKTLDKLISELNEDALQNFRVERTSHSEIEKYREKVKINAVKASKTKANNLAKSVGEKVGETLLIEEIEIERPPNNYYPYYGYYAANQNNYSLYSNASESIPNGQNQDGASAMFKKIKLRYEIKAIYRLE